MGGISSAKYALIDINNTIFGLTSSNHLAIAVLRKSDGRDPTVRRRVIQSLFEYRIR